MNAPLLGIGLAALVLAATPGVAGARDYYVSPSGSDAAPGTQSAPWRTVGKVNGAALAPGDRVAFRGGASFGGTLMPSRSGTASAPVTYQSYGAGKANLAGGVWMRSVSHLAFSNLVVDGAATAFGSSMSGAGVKRVRFTGVEARNATLGFNAVSTADAHWTIRDSIVDRTQDSGVHSWAAHTRVENTRISNTGLGHARYAYALHGIYVKGARFRAIGNELWNNPDPTGTAISTRYRDALIERNHIHDTPNGISYYRDDPRTGTTTIRRNTFRNVSAWALYIGPGNRVPGVGEHFRVYDNTVVNRTMGRATAAFNWQSTGGRRFVFRGNAVQGFRAVLQRTSGVRQSGNVLRRPGA